MKKPDIVKRIARRSGVSTGEAADRMDGAVREILANLRRRKAAPFPGLGKFTRDSEGGVAFERQREQS